MSANSGRSPADATTLIHNAKIYCFDEGDSTADSILIQAGRVATIGRHSDLISLTDGATETLDLRGATVLPGLIDTHPHLLHFAARQAPLVDISDATSHDGIVERIAARAQTTAAGDWIMTTPVGEAWYFTALLQGLVGRRIADTANSGSCDQPASRRHHGVGAKHPKYRGVQFDGAGQAWRYPRAAGSGVWCDH
jgi:predicted amidohydrolase YtcJ